MDAGDAAFSPAGSVNQWVIILTLQHNHPFTISVKVSTSVVGLYSVNRGLYFSGRSLLNMVLIAVLYLLS